MCGYHPNIFQITKNRNKNRGRVGGVFIEFDPEKNTGRMTALITYKRNQTI